MRSFVPPLSRRQVLRGVPVVVCTAVAGCQSGGTETATPIRSSITVTAQDGQGDGDGTLTVRWRPATVQGFSFGQEGVSYRTDEGDTYVILQLALTARDASVTVRRNYLRLYHEGSTLPWGPHIDDIFDDGMPDDRVLEPDTTVSGYLAFQIDADISRVTFRNIGHRDFFDVSYSTDFVRDEELEFSITPVE